MRHYPLIALLLLTFVGCNRPKQLSLFGSLPATEQVSERVLSSIKQHDSLTWATVVGVIDTINASQNNHEIWPEEAVGEMIDKFWHNKPLPEFAYQPQLSPELNAFVLDTMRANRFRNYVDHYEYSGWDMIYMADYFQSTYQYLNRKYTRLVRAQTTGTSIYHMVYTTQPLWNSVYESMKTAVDSVYLGPDPYLMRELDHLRLNIVINHNRLQSIAEFYLIMADPKFKVTVANKAITHEDVEHIAQICQDRFKHPSQQRALIELRRRWNIWYGHRQNFNRFLLPGEEKHKYEKHLQNILHNQYRFFESMYEKGYVYK